MKWNSIQFVAYQHYALNYYYQKVPSICLSLLTFHESDLMETFCKGQRKAKNGHISHIFRTLMNFKRKIYVSLN